MADEAGAARSVLIAGMTLVLSACTESDLQVPYALMRDGRIEVIRHCEAPATAAGYARCRELWCERALRERISNPAEAMVEYQSVPKLDGDLAEDALTGRIRYRTSFSIPLPDAFTCRTDGRRVLSIETLGGHG